MALSDYEKQVLAELEAELMKDSTRQGESTQRAAQAFNAAAELGRSRGRLSVRRIAIGAVVAVIGLALLVFAVSLGASVVAIALGAAAFLLVVGGIYFALHPVDAPKLDAVPTDGAPEASTKRQGRSAQARPGRLRRFMEDQERRWDERER